MTKVRDLHRKWMENKEYRKVLEELKPEFALARELIQARIGKKDERTLRLSRKNSRVGSNP